MTSLHIVYQGVVSILETELTRCNDELKDLRLQTGDDPGSSVNVVYSNQYDFMMY